MTPVALPATVATSTAAAATSTTAAATSAAAAAAASTTSTSNTTTAASPLPDAPSSPLLVLHVGSLAGHAYQPPLGQDAGRQPAPVDTARVKPHGLVEHLQPPRRVVPEEHRLGARPLSSSRQNRRRREGGASGRGRGRSIC